MKSSTEQMSVQEFRHSYVKKFSYSAFVKIFMGSCANIGTSWHIVLYFLHKEWNIPGWIRTDSLNFILALKGIFTLASQTENYPRGIISSIWITAELNKKNVHSYLPLWDIPTERHFWKRQYWHLLRFFFWILQLRSHLS